MNLSFRQRFGGAGFQDGHFANRGFAGVDEVVAGVAEGVAAEGLADRVGFEGVEYS